jgi:spermidine synthase
MLVKGRMQAIIFFSAIFFAGLATLGIEISASRLLGTVFGTSNIVWANIIGLILVYLTLGYFLGGRWADRSPKHETFYGIMAWAGFSAGVVPLIARPVLLRAARAVETLDVAVMAGSFLSVLILFVVPVTLLGTVSPFAIRLSIRGTEEAGRVAGRIYALSTLGSILGTFLPVLVMIPALGTARTFLAFSLLILLIALGGLATINWKLAARYLWMPALLLLAAMTMLSGPIKDTAGKIFETESAYNYIQVVERDGVRYLLLNEGQGVHSMYDPTSLATYGTWDYFLAAPYFLSPPPEVKRVGLVGLAAGTIAKQFTAVYGAIPIDGWEIDPRIIEVGRRYFAMTEPNLNAYAMDGRWGLAHSSERYTVIGVDAYRLPYIPFHLTTREFFQLARDHLEEDGVLVINVGRTPSDRRLVDALASTLQTVFPSVFVVDVPQTFNSIVVATNRPASVDDLLGNYLEAEKTGLHPLLGDVLKRAVLNLQPTPPVDIVFTDDWAPIESLTDSMALAFLLQGDLEGLR